MLPWRLPTQALDSIVTFLNTTDCRTGRRARQPRPMWTSAGCSGTDVTLISVYRRSSTLQQTLRLRRKIVVEHTLQSRNTLKTGAAALTVMRYRPLSARARGAALWVAHKTVMASRVNTGAGDRAQGVNAVGLGAVCSRCGKGGNRARSGAEESENTPRNSVIARDYACGVNRLRKGEVATGRAKPDHP